MTRSSSAELTRRELLRLAAGVPLASLWPATGRGQARRAGALPFGLEAFRAAPGRVHVVGDPSGAGAVRLVRAWEGPRCRSGIKNTGTTPAAVREVALFDVSHALDGQTRLYGEGFQMLSQTEGTLGQPKDLGDYTDAKHYRMPQPADATVVYNLLTLAPPAAPRALAAFTSCRRFSGRFELRPGAIRVVVDTEGRELGAGETWELEDFLVLSGDDREVLLAQAAETIELSHPRLPFPAPPAGWCSWYCFGPRVTAEDVLRNLEVIARDVPGLRYIQVDDGYQPAMGDWLETGAAFGGDVQGVLKAIRAKGFEPAIWVAPFIAEKDSNLFKAHPGWFVKDADGQPLRADQVTFGGWRRGPWYAVDGTHPGAQAHLESVFRTMRTEWGCTYFKLDANFWGAIHGGRFHDPRATRVEAYRGGMQAVLRGAGDAFVLGCNHPMWPSLGLIHGSRSSNDIKRTWKRVEGTARQNLSRNWQNGRLWWNDPDAVTLTELPEEEALFHATAIYATGGMILSGDDLTRIEPGRLALLRKLEPPTGTAARFAADALSVGIVEREGERVACLLNAQDAPATLTFPLARPSRLRELWSGEDLGVRPAGEVALTLPPHAGRVVVCTPAG
ncbi:MAG TPA: alpha-galactosidase [Vicinamibacteria bacterium]|nr:alpha-galactosidase [Vicinamibacteria bacterium]